MLLISSLMILTTNVLKGETLQQRIVSGLVISSDDNLPLAGVSVLIKGTTQGTVTDANGNFSVAATENNVLVFSFIGFITQEIQAKSSIINVTMYVDLEELEEVVVVGYGTIKKVNLTGSVSTIDTKEFASRPITQTSQALQGKMAGVTVTQSFGIPGNNTGTIRIRGIGTLGDKNDPMVLIDGVEGNMNDISPKDIETISVLKDAASSAIYGSRAANGVILITTKRGNRNEAMSVTFSGLSGMQLPTDLPQKVDGATYMMIKNENERNNGRNNLYSDAYIQEYMSKKGTEPYFDTDWYDAAMKDQAMQYQYDVTVRGGTEKISGMVSFSDLSQDAFIDNTNFRRKTFRFNTDFQATNKLSFAFDGSLYTHTQVEPSRGTGTLFQMMAETPDIYPALWADGTYGEGWNGDNPLGHIYEGGSRKQTNTRVILSIKGKYDFTDWLSAEFRYAPKYMSTYRSSMVKQYTFRRIDGSEGIRPTGRNSLSNLYNKTLENFYQALVRINQTFGEHSFSAYVGFEALDNRYLNFQASRENFLLPDYEVLSGGDANYKDNSGGGSEYSLLSYFGRVNYSYQNKYLFEANLRYDGSSRFAKENRWGLFPSFSAGWRISEEDFMKDIELLSNLKIRASWGRLGNQNIGNYAYHGLISINSPSRTVPYYFGKTAVVGGAQTVLPNEKVTWETTENMNFGLDFGFMNNRLTGNLDVYKRNTYDILYTRDIPVIMGLSASEQNIAKVQNIGWDLQLGWQDNVGGFHYGIDLVLSDVHNKVVYLAGKPVYGRNILFEGEEYNAYYGFECIGIYRSQEDFDKYPAMNANVRIGDLIFKDQDGDGKIDEINDRTIIGSTIPRYNYGLNISMDYRGFDFNIFLQGVGKKNLYYNVYNAGYGGSYYTYQLGRLTPDDQSTWATANWPRIDDGNSGSASNQINSFYVFNAAYLRCKNLVLGYTIPQSILNKIKLSSLRIYLTSQNIFTIKNMKVNTIDPESPDTVSTGTSYYPNTKTFALGFDVKF